MSGARRVPLVLVVVVVLVATGLLTSFEHAKNPSVLPSGLAVSMNAESTALYCTGLSGGAGRAGRVTFYNTADVSRSLSVSVISDKGDLYTNTIELAGHASQSLEPSVLDKGKNFAVAVQISGGGVVGEEIAGTNRALAGCAASGVTKWYGSGFNTLVGSSAYLSVYNPTATAAVLNATLYSALGVSVPQSLQGLSVPAHTQSEVDLNSAIVNTANVAVGVRVVRGSLVIVGVQDANGVVSLDSGATALAKESWFPSVTTAKGASAEIRVANPNAQPADLAVKVALGQYRVATQDVSVAPYSTGLVVITPNPAIPDAGYASLAVRSNVPIIATLAAGALARTGAFFALSAPETPGAAFLVRDFTGLGFDAATVTNVSSRSVTLSIASVRDDDVHSVSVVGGIKLGAGESKSLSSLVTSLTTQHHVTYLVTASRPVVVVTLTLPSRPVGVNVVAPLDGR